MPHSIETSRSQLLRIKPDDDDSIIYYSELLADAYREQDDKTESLIKEEQRQRYLFSYRGRKRHESRPHHLPASPVKAEAIISGQPDNIPWRR